MRNVHKTSSPTHLRFRDAALVGKQAYTELKAASNRRHPLSVRNISFITPSMLFSKSILNINHDSVKMFMHPRPNKYLFFNTQSFHKSLCIFFSLNMQRPFYSNYLFNFLATILSQNEAPIPQKLEDVFTFKKEPMLMEPSAFLQVL